MGMYKYVRESWNNPSDSLKAIQHDRYIKWRADNATVKIEYPARIDRARSLGYRAKEGMFLVRQRVSRGGHRKPFPMAGRRSKKWTTRKTLAISYQVIAEQRAASVYHNCEVLNSYEVGKDGKNYWFEVIMVDRNHPAVLADPVLSKVVNTRGRSFRGLTSASKRSRGLLNKGKGAEKLRPSKTANRDRRFY